LKGCTVRTPAGGCPRPVRVTLPGAEPPRRDIAPRDDGATLTWDYVLKYVSMLDFGVRTVKKGGSLVGTGWVPRKPTAAGLRPI